MTVGRLKSSRKAGDRMGFLNPNGGARANGNQMPTLHFSKSSATTANRISELWCIYPLTNIRTLSSTSLGENASDRVLGRLGNLSNSRPWLLLDSSALSIFFSRNLFLIPHPLTNKSRYWRHDFVVPNIKKAASEAVTPGINSTISIIVF